MGLSLGLQLVTYRTENAEYANSEIRIRRIIPAITLDMISKVSLKPLLLEGVGGVSEVVSSPLPKLKVSAINRINYTRLCSAFMF